MCFDSHKAYASEVYALRNSWGLPGIPLFENVIAYKLVTWELYM